MEKITFFIKYIYRLENLKPILKHQKMFNRFLSGAVSSRGKEAIRQLSNRLLSKPLATPFLQTRTIIVRTQHRPIIRNELPFTKSPFNAVFISNTRGFYSDSTNMTEEDWLGDMSHMLMIPIPFTFMAFLFALFPSKEGNLPHIVNVVDPILHQPAREVYPEQIRSEHVQKTIDDMVKAMRRERVASLSAPQIGVPIKIIVLEDTKLYMAPSPNEVNEKQDRHPSDLLVIVNPKLRITNYQTTQFFEGCVSVTGHLARVKRFLKVEVTGLDRNGQPIKVDASGCQARILQHACDHLEGILFIDKLVK